MLTVSCDHRYDGSAQRRPFSYRCGFCREVLRPRRGGVYQKLLPLFGVRVYKCPHCFGCRVLPCGWLKLLTLPFWTISIFWRRLRHA